MRIALPTIDPAALAGHDPSAAVIDLSGETMGTMWSVRYAATARSDPSRIRSAIVARLAGLVREVSHWEPDSLLSRFNRAPAGSWTTLPPDFAHVMARGLDIARVTGGAFDPTIGEMVNLWGYGPHDPYPSALRDPSLSQREREKTLQVAKGEGDPAGALDAAAPQDSLIQAARATSGHHRLAYEPTARLLRQPGRLSLDLSGIAKGHAVDAIAGLLATRGIAHCLVEIGGELVGRGIRPDGDPWWVDLESPPDLTLPPLRIALHDIAVATSGNYRKGDHTLDPRTGYPSDQGVVSASVIHHTALEADAWATALTVLGPGGLPLADESNIAARLVTVGNGFPQEHLSCALEAMLAA